VCSVPQERLDEHADSPCYIRLGCYTHYMGTTHRTFKPNKDSANFNERNAAYALAAGDFDYAEHLKSEFYRLGTEDDCCHEDPG
jgi:hypothetical protein